MRTKVDRYKKVSPKWWYDNHTGRWIHDDHMGFILLGKPSAGSKLPSAFKNNKAGNRTY